MTEHETLTVIRIHDHVQSLQALREGHNPM
jgi:hypothetical protein